MRLRAAIVLVCGLSVACGRTALEDLTSHGSGGRDGDDGGPVIEPTTDEEPAVCACSFPSVCNQTTCESPVGTWTDLGPSGTGDGIRGVHSAVGSPSVAYDATGMPVIAWAKGDSTGPSGRQIEVVRWNGAAWDDVGEITQQKQNPAYIGIKNFDGDLILTWSDTTTSYLLRWNGTSWDEMGGSATGDGLNTTGLDVYSGPESAVSADGTLYVTQQVGTTTIQVLRWTGSAWTGLGDSATTGIGSGANASYVAMRVCNNRPTVAWTNENGDYDIFLKQWDGSAWTELDGSATGAGLSDGTSNSAALRPKLACDDAAIWATWYEYPASAIYAKRYDGQRWEALAGSSSGQGISDGAPGASGPDIVLTADGQPLIVWYDLSNPNRVVYRRWDGAAWVGYNGEDTIFTSALLNGPSAAVSARGDVFVAWIAQPASGLGLYGREWR